MADETSPARPWLLMVEDEAALAGMLRASLETDFEIDVAGTVEEASLLLGTRAYAVILSDHVLPGEAQGLDFLLEALRRQPAAKRILMTGYMNPELVGRSVAVAQLSACLFKPVNLSKLRQELQIALAT